jgi:RNA polymerase sigma factor (sigma-70 family)
MSHPPLDAVLRHVRRLALEEAPAELADQQLLRRFADERDEAAFAQLVRRHGAMVLGLCRRLLQDPHAADDAFQATFLTLARRPGVIRQQASVGGWLHRVAFRVAQRARYVAGRRRAHERQAPVSAGPDPRDEISWREVREVLDAELQALPDQFRAPLVLCYLEGQTRDEAAQQLGWSVGTVKGRLERGRDMLRRRLTRRGVTLSSALLGTSLTGASASAVPAVLAAETVRRAAAFAAGQAAGLPPSVTRLADGALHGLGLTRLKAAVLVLLAGVAAAAGVWWHVKAGPPAAQDPPDKPPAQAAPAPKAEDPKAVRSDRHGDPLPRHASTRLGSMRFRHDWTLYVTALSPDGRLLAGGGNRSVQVWNAETGQTLYRLHNYVNGVNALAFSPDGKRLASYDHNMTLRITDAATGKAVREFSLLKQALLANSFTGSDLVFLPGGKQLLIKDGREPVVRLFDLDKGAEVRAFPCKGEHLYSVAVSPEGKTLAVIEEDGTVRLWEVATGKERLAFKKHEQYSEALAFAPDGKTLATGGAEGVAYLWDAATGKPVHTLDARVEQTPGGRKVRPGAIRSLSFAPDGKSLLSSHGYLIVFWDPATGKELRRQERDRAESVRFLPDGKTLFAGGGRGSHGNTCYFLDAATGKPCRRFDGHDSRVEALAYSPDGKYVATAEEGGSAEVRVWETGSGRVVLRVGNQRGYGRAAALAFSPKGDVLATGHGRLVVLWDLKTGKPLRQFPGHEHVHLALAFSADGTRLASGGHDGTVRLWDLAAGKELQQFRVEKGNAWAIAFSPDLRLAASGDQEADTLHLWDLATGKEWKRLRRGGAGSVRLDFSPDGRTLVEGSGTSQLILWEMATGEQRRVITLPNHPWCTACSPDGRLLAVGEVDPPRRGRQITDPRVAVRIIDLAADRVVETLLGHEGSVYALQFAPDSRTLASASGDTTALLWDVAALDAAGPAAPLTPEQRAACWADLAGGAKQAYAGLWKLAADPGAVEMLRRELRPPAAPPEAAVVERLLAELDSDQFKVRAKAREQLAGFGPAVESALRKALAGKPPIEVRRSVDGLLQAIDSQRVRARRAVEVLELINTAAARELLGALAKGAAGAWLTQEAKESLDRLSRRPVRGN